MKLIINDEEYIVSEEQLFTLNDYVFEQTMKQYMSIPVPIRSIIKTCVTNFIIPQFVKGGLLEGYPHRNEDPIFIGIAVLLSEICEYMKDGNIRIGLQTDEQHNVTTTTFSIEQEQGKSKGGGQLGISRSKRQRKNNIRQKATSIA